jgi:hypothetical protein
MRAVRVLLGITPCKIAETLCQRITVGRDEIDTTLSYLPSSEEPCKNTSCLQ